MYNPNEMLPEQSLWVSSSSQATPVILSYAVSVNHSPSQHILVSCQYQTWYSFSSSSPERDEILHRIPLHQFRKQSLQPFQWKFQEECPYPHLSSEQPCAYNLEDN